MTAAASHPRSTSRPAAAGDALDPRVLKAVDDIAAVLELRASPKSELVRFIESLAAPEKFPHVSFYAARLRGGGINYRITYRVPGFPLRTERLGRMPKPAQQRARRVSEILQQVKARMMKPQDAHRVLYVDTTPIDVHVKKFEASLKSKNNVDRYNVTVITRLRRCIELAGFERMSDVQRNALPNLIEKLREFRDPDTKRPLSGSTINDYLATLRQFTKWATPDLLPADPLVNSGGIKTTDKKTRRDVLIDEVSAIVETARASTANYRFRGDDRAMLYLTAYGTGLRANELRSLEIPWLKLDVAQPFMAMPADVQKKTGKAKDVRHPIPTWLAAELTRWLNGRTTGKVWMYLPRDIAPIFERDRADARRAWIDAAADPQARAEREKSDFLARETTDGEVVFHSNRHSFATNALASLDLKTAQMLTRHATAAMLTDRYAHTRIERAAEGVEKAIKSPLGGDSKR